MPSCPECENNLDVELDEVEEGDVSPARNVGRSTRWSAWTRWS